MKKQISCFALALILCSGSVFANENNDLRTLFLTNKANICGINLRTFNAKDTNGNEIIDENEEQEDSTTEKKKTKKHQKNRNTEKSTTEDNEPSNILDSKTDNNEKTDKSKSIAVPRSKRCTQARFSAPLGRSVSLSLLFENVLCRISASAE